MTAKRYDVIDKEEPRGQSVTYEGIPCTARTCVTRLNRLTEENEQLKKELKVYRKVASCSNCHYHNYDWFDDGDEFEVCDKGNDVTEGICEDWEEL